MYRYTIDCTFEQIKKALELGAPIERDEYEDRPYVYIDDAYLIPTAEQMRGWLMDKLQITTWHIDYFPTPGKYGYTIIGRDVVIEQGRGALTKDLYDSYNKATLAAIDAALKYLIKKKGE